MICAYSRLNNIFLQTHDKYNVFIEIMFSNKIKVSVNTPMLSIIKSWNVRFATQSKVASGTVNEVE